MKRITCSVGIIVDAIGTEACYHGYLRQQVVFEMEETSLFYRNVDMVRFPLIEGGSFVAIGLLIATPEGFVYHRRIDRGLKLEPLNTLMAPPDGVKFGLAEKPDHREHLASNDCWCEPILDTTTESGAQVWVHRGLQ